MVLSGLFVGKDVTEYVEREGLDGVKGTCKVFYLAHRVSCPAKVRTIILLSLGVPHYVHGLMETPQVLNVPISALRFTFPTKTKDCPYLLEASC